MARSISDAAKMPALAAVTVYVPQLTLVTGHCLKQEPY
jgi:hypothetical protein